MLARHPKTGAPIRILTSEGTIWRDAKTLVWLDGSENPREKWGRWDIGVSSLEAWRKVSPFVSVDICILLGDVQEAIRWLEAGTWQECTMVAIPKAVLEALGIERLRALQITNSICLEEAIQIYPYLEVQWDGTEEDARALVALLLQYKKSAPIPAGTAHAAVAESFGLRLNPVLTPPPPLYFITQYFVHSRAKRSKEIAHCLKQNVECDFIDKVILLNEKVYDLPVTSAKVEQVVIGERLRFDHVLRWIQDHAPEGALVAVANSDIYLDATWRTLWSTTLDDKFISLLRWDEQEDPTQPPKLFGPRPDSQDTWALSADSVKKRSWNWDAIRIPFGKGGCDNAFNVEMLRQKFLVVNPCMTLRTHHVHMSGIRNYDPTDIVEKPIYMHLNPTGIHDLQPMIQIADKPTAVVAADPREIVLEGEGLTASQRATFLTMIGKTWEELKAQTEIPAVKIPLYCFEKVSQTHDGLLHSYNSIVVGPTKTASDAWSKTELSIVSAHLDCDVGLVAYCPERVSSDPVRYLLQYLGKILVLRDLAGGKGEWMSPRNPKIVEALKLFRWDHETMPVLERVPGFQIWCHKAYTWLPQDGIAALPTPQEVSALRKALAGWIETHVTESKRIVCILDDTWVTEAFVERLEAALAHKNMTVSCIYPDATIGNRVALLRGAYGVITLGGAGAMEHWGLLWALPTGAHVWDIQVEIAPSVEVYRLATASELKHHLHIVPRSRPIGKDVEQFQESVERAVCASGTLSIPSAAVPSASKPLIVMPHTSTKGFFSHAGDSFREMVQLWKQKGFVDLAQIEGIQQVWLDGIGKTLLYDRPTLEWLEKANSMERAFTTGLFGNPVPPSNGTTKPWFFWPRRPMLVEELVALGIGKAGWNDRHASLVFYGRSENQIQKGHRSREDWAAACSEFLHVEGATASYPFSQREYLKRLATARLGLCLAGYGKKCHREIECMAMGCVPVVAPEVDMDSYAEAPVEGVHYFRVQNAVEAKRIVESLQEDTWTKMSDACRAWWRRNASADGSWDLTKRLLTSS